MTVTVSNLDRFLEKAHQQFQPWRDTETQRKAPYIDVPVRIGKNSLPDGLDDAMFANPLLFLTGIRTRATGSHEHLVAASPSVSLIVGQYGMGKTELIYQACRLMAYSVEQPLPLNLALCDAARISQASSAADMADLLFGRIASQLGLQRPFLLDELQPAIRDGRVVLLLDGLDELISTQAQHYAFFRGLLAFLRHGDRTNEERFKIAVTMRKDYLAGVSDERILADFRAPIYYISLDYLDDSGVEAYLRVRLPEMAGIYGEIASRRLLLDMFRRPLLLRIFCELASRPKYTRQRLFELLQQNSNPVTLLKEFIDRAAEDDPLNEAQKEISPLTWNPEELARQSLDLFRNGESEFTVKQLRDVVTSTVPGLTRDDINRFPPTEILKGIHKCPFLRQNEKSLGVDSEDVRVARFAHKIFFEYFTTAAIAAEMRTDSDGEGSGDKRAFHELALNVDMSQFLRGLTGSDEKWRRETGKAYGLVDAKDLEEWAKHKVIDLATLDETRWQLLEFRNDPERRMAVARPLVDDFLKCEKAMWLHPRYLMYNYEAVAVYLWYTRRDPAVAELRRDFGEILGDRLKKVLSDLRKSDTEERRAKSLLLERILDIGRRLKYKWVEGFADNRHVLFSVIDAENEDVEKRVALILQDIAVTVF